jgi:hypothetical protein
MVALRHRLIFTRSARTTCIPTCSPGSLQGVADRLALAQVDRPLDYAYLVGTDAAGAITTATGHSCAPSASAS